MKKIIFLFVLVILFAGQEKAFAGNISQATAAIQTIEQTYGDTYAPTALSDCESNPGCYNALVGVAKQDGVQIGNITPNTAPKPVTNTPAAASGTGTNATTGTGTASAQVDNVTSGNFAFNKFGSIEENLLKAGPQEAQSLANVSGQLFAYLAVISLIVWVIQNLLFGDKGIKEFFLFFFFLMFARGLLAGYNFFFVDGVVNMFYSLGQTVAGVQNPMSLFQNIFYSFYQIFDSQFTILNNHVTAFNFFALFSSQLLYFVGIIVLIIAFILVAGTIFLIEGYIIIALVTGYLFVPMMIFKPLEFLWNGWLKFLISSALGYFIVFVVLKMFSLFMVNTLENYIQAINVNASYSLSSIINELVYTFILLVFSYLVTKIPSIAGEIVSGMPNMNVSAIIAPVVNSFNKISSSAGKTAGKTVEQIRSAAGKGGK